MRPSIGRDESTTRSGEQQKLLIERVLCSIEIVLASWEANLTGCFIASHDRVIFIMQRHHYL